MRSACAALFVTLVCTLFLVAPALAGSITYTYDDAGRLLTADYGNGSAIAYTYDNAGNLLARTVGLDNISLTITILSPTERTYASQCVRLTFIVEPEGTELDWIGYSLDGGANVTISGNTTIGGLSAGDHTIVVYANDTEGTMVASNTVSFTVHPGDINDDGVVDLDDLTLLAAAAFTMPGVPGWNSNADLNCDDIIDLDDLTILSDNAFTVYV